MKYLYNIYIYIYIYIVIYQIKFCTSLYVIHLLTMSSSPRLGHQLAADNLEPWIHGSTFYSTDVTLLTNLTNPYINGLTTKGKSKPETIDFPMKIMGISEVSFPFNQSIVNTLK